MSWSVQKTAGIPDKVRTAIEADFDRAAKQYEGTPEGADILAARTSVTAWLVTTKQDEGVIVEASGSRGEGWLNIKVECSRVALKI